MHNDQTHDQVRAEQEEVTGYAMRTGCFPPPEPLVFIPPAPNPFPMGDGEDRRPLDLFMDLSGWPRIRRPR